MAAFSREIQSYKYFVEESGGGNREIMDRKVYDEKKKAPARYASTLLRTNVFFCTAILSYLKLLGLVAVYQPWIKGSALQSSCSIL